jgi:hypothetical protein
LISSSIAEQQQTHPVEVPAALSQLIALNLEYGVLLCVSSKYCKAVSPTSIVEYLRTIHQTSRAVRKQVQEYVQGFPAWYSWLQYTKWDEVLSQSKHDMVKTSQFTRQPDPEEPELGRVLKAMEPHFKVGSRHLPLFCYPFPQISDWSKTRI